MAFRDDMVAIADQGRSIADDLGLRLHTVVVRTTTWSGTEVGRGTATHADLTLEPPPKVKSPTPRMIAAAPGLFEEGDRVVEKISATTTEAQLTGRPLASSKELVWLIDGDPYRVVGKPEESFLGWKVHLRRARGRPS